MPTHAAPTAEQLRHAWRHVSRPGWPDTLEQALQTQPYRTCLHGIARNLQRRAGRARPQPAPAAPPAQALPELPLFAHSPEGTTP